MCISLSTLVEVSRLFIPVIAGVGIFIAWQQFTANREKIRLDLYDKRFKLYQTIKQTVFDFTYGKEEINRENYHYFLSVCSEAQFLVPEDVYTEIKKAERLITKLKLNKERLSNNYTEKVASLIVKIESELEEFFPEVTDSFKKVLKFNKF